jgi:hypothetical protein
VGELSISKYGFVYSEENPPPEDAPAVIAGSDHYLGSFSESVTGLQPGKTYYYAAFAEENGTLIKTYGEVMSFTTLTPEAPSVITFPAINITETSATCKGEVTGDGGKPVTKRGFCIGEQPNPAINGPHSDNGTGTGQFTHTFVSLNENTTYFIRAYAINAIGIAYGSQQSFTTHGGGGPANEWLHYDDGMNANSIGLNGGGDFDVAIRFDPSQLQPFNGWKLTKFRFFPVIGDPVYYSIELFTGQTGTTLEYIQDVETVVPNQWNEVILDDVFVINAGEALYAGYWVQNQPEGIYPAGTDAGPAITGKGDLISVGGEEWEALSNISPDLDYNWNLQIFVTNDKGETKMIPSKIPQHKHKIGKRLTDISVSAANPSNR